MAGTLLYWGVCCMILWPLSAEAVTLGRICQHRWGCCASANQELLTLKLLVPAVSCSYIIGLPLHQRNATAMSRAIMITAKKELGSAVLGFELGNEVSSSCHSVSARLHWPSIQHSHMEYSVWCIWL